MITRLNYRGAGVLVAALMCSAVSGQGKKQVFRAQTPAWVMAGQTTVVRLIGDDLAPKEVRFVHPGLTARVLKVGPSEAKSDEEKRLGSMQAEVEISAASDLKPGLYAFQLIGEGVPTADGKLLVDVAAPEVQEKEPNNTLREPQELPQGPVTALGKLDNEGADVFRFQGKAGETWRIEVFARRLNAATKLEICMRLRDPRLAPVRAAVDQGQDCAIEYRLPLDGPHLVELFDGDNKSGADFNYRLTLRRPD